MRRWLVYYFAFTRRELNGIAVLGGLLLVVWVIAYFYRRTAPAEVDLAAHIQDIEQFLTTNDEADRTIEVGMVDVEYFTFNPNGLAVVDWKRLGLSDRQVRMIKNYEAKGGQFRKKEDLGKIYAISEADYARLEPYIRIPEKPATKPAFTNKPEERMDHDAYRNQAEQRVRIELNSVDSIDLQVLSGIGPVFASRIVRFRDLLGGFHDISQLLKVYGLDSARFEDMKEHVYVDTTKMVKLPINTADYERLRRHPLVSPKLANAIVQYRKQHGNYQELTDLLNIALMDEEIFRNIVPYLTLSDD